MAAAETPSVHEALEAAVAALDIERYGFNAQHFVEISQSEECSPAVQANIRLTDALCILMGKETGWQSVKGLFADGEGLITAIQNYPKDELTPPQVGAVSALMDEYPSSFDPEEARKWSGALKGIAMWIGAVVAYSKLRSP